MGQMQVILKGENWKRRALVCLVLCALGLILLEVWNPGTISAIYSEVRKTAVWIYNFAGAMIKSLQTLARNIGLSR